MGQLDAVCRLMVLCCAQDASHPGNVTATLRNIMHGRMQPIPAFVSPACADVIRKALSRSAKMRITLDELADHPWIRNRAAEFPRSWSGGGCMASGVPSGVRAFLADFKSLL